MAKTKIISLTQSKGGTAKTTSVVNIAAGLAKLGNKVLCIDLDQQGSLTLSLGVNPTQLKYSMRHVLVEEKKPAEILVETNEQNIDLLPANMSLAMVEFYMPAMSRERVLARNLVSISSNYDYILMDTPPSFAITTLNALSAADYVLVPVQPEPLCLYGLAENDQLIQQIKRNTNPSLKTLGLFVTMYDGRSRYHKEIVEQLKQDWPEALFDTVVRNRKNVLESTVAGQSTVTSQPNSEIAQDYLNVVKEIISRAK